jgi:hypothetical protein
METIKTAVWVTAIFACLIASAVRAEDNCTGYDVLVTQTAESSDLGQGHSVTIVRQTSLLITEDTPIYNLVSGMCQGSLLTTPDGKTRGSGHCARHEKTATQ